MPGTKSSDKAVAMILPGRQYACGNVEKCMSYGVVPSRHIVLALTIRGLRPRLPSLRSVVPSRHKSSYTCTFGCGSERTEICFLARALRIIFPKNPPTQH